MISNIFLLLSSFLIIYLDIKHRKVFNFIAYPLMAAAVVINVYLFGLSGVLYSSIGFTVGLLTCYIAYKLKFSGLGEFKLLALVGILKGYYFVLFAGFLSYILISLVHIFSIVSSGAIKIIIQNSKVYLDLVMQYGISISTIIEEHLQRPKVPYSVAVLTAIIMGLGLGM